MTQQFENPANADIYSRTTAREIVVDFAGRRLGCWVTAFGTGGTLLGVSRVLAAKCGRRLEFVFFRPRTDDEPKG